MYWHRTRTQTIRSTGADERPRPGYTLVELLVVFGLISVVFASVAITMHTLAKLNHRLQADGPHSETLTRLSLRLRDDAHGAVQWSVERPADSGFLVRLTCPDESLVVYETRTDAVVRRVMRGEQRVHEELFRLPGATDIHWETLGEHARLITLRVEQQGGKISGAGDAVRVNDITAALGLHAGTR